MKLRELFENTGRIVKGVNTTPDVGVDQVSKEAAKFGFKVDKDGVPPTLSKKVKGKSTNVLFNLGLTESVSKDELKKQLAMGVKVEMEHTDDPKEALKIAMDHLREDPLYYDKLKFIESSKLQENVFTNVYKALRQLIRDSNSVEEALDVTYRVLRKSKRYKHHTDKKIQQMSHGVVQKEWPKRFDLSDEELEILKKERIAKDFSVSKPDKMGQVYDPNKKMYVDPSELGENFADGKKKGKSRPGRVKKAGASCKGSVSSLRAKAKKYSGEKGKMYHWCANMKGGKK